MLCLWLKACDTAAAHHSSASDKTVQQTKQYIKQTKQYIKQSSLRSCRQAIPVQLKSGSTTYPYANIARFSRRVSKAQLKNSHCLVVLRYECTCKRVWTSAVRLWQECTLLVVCSVRVISLSPVFHGPRLQSQECIDCESFPEFLEITHWVQHSRRSLIFVQLCFPHAGRFVLWTGAFFRRLPQLTNMCVGHELRSPHVQLQESAWKIFDHWEADVVFLLTIRALVGADLCPYCEQLYLLLLL